MLLCLVTRERASADDRGKDEWFGEDKAKHFAASFLLETLSYNFYVRNVDSESKAKAAAFFTSLAVGVAKEFVDDEFSWEDLAWDAAGAGFGVAVHIKF
jgi:putative lipoprotein